MNPTPNTLPEAETVPAPVAVVVIPAAVWEAVSYTHLRAHETVLDLVCRLLLEKKKTITISHSSYTV